MSDSSTPTTPAAAPTPTPTPTEPAKKKRGWITPVLALVAALAIGLVGGVLIGHGTAASASSNRAGSFTRGQAGGGTGGFGGGAGGFGGGTRPSGAPTGGAGGFAGGGFTSGTIVSISGDSIVVKAQDGTQKTITTDSNTKVTKTDTSSLTDLKAGETITVVGAADSSGNVKATSVSEGASALGGGFGGRQRGTGGAGGAGGSSTGSN